MSLFHRPSTSQIGKGRLKTLSAKMATELTDLKAKARFYRHLATDECFEGVFFDPIQKAVYRIKPTDCPLTLSEASR